MTSVSEHVIMNHEVFFFNTGPRFGNFSEAVVTHGWSLTHFHLLIYNFIIIINNTKIYYLFSPKITTLCTQTPPKLFILHFFFLVDHVSRLAQQRQRQKSHAKKNK